MRGEETVDGAGRQAHAGVHLAGEPGGANEALDRSLRTLLAQRQEQVLYRLGNRSARTAIRARTRFEAVKTHGFVKTDPIPGRRAADPCLRCAGNRPFPFSDALKEAFFLSRCQRSRHQFADDAVAKQRDLLAQGPVHGRNLPRKPRRPFPGGPKSVPQVALAG